MAFRLSDPLSEPWGEFCRRGICAFHDLSITAARRVRDNPEWDPEGGTEDDWMSLELLATDRLMWWHNNMPTDLKIALEEIRRKAPEANAVNGIPLWGVRIAEAVGGALAMGVRLGREVDEVIASKGLLVVDSSEEAAPLTEQLGAG